MRGRVLMWGREGRELRRELDLREGWSAFGTLIGGIRHHGVICLPSGGDAIRNGKVHSLSVKILIV